MYEFYQDVAEKKKAASGARHRVVRSKTKYVGLKNYSAAERRKMNGDVVMYTINERHTWHEIKKWPQDLRMKHLEYLIEECGMTGNEMARSLDCATSTITRMKNLEGITPMPRNLIRTPEQRDNYLRIMGLTKDMEETAETEAPAADTEAADNDYTQTMAVPEDGNLTFYGDFASALKTAGVLLGAGKGKIVISWRVHDEEEALG